VDGILVVCVRYAESASSDDDVIFLTVFSVLSAVADDDAADKADEQLSLVGDRSVEDSTNDFDGCGTLEGPADVEMCCDEGSWLTERLSFCVDLMTSSSLTVDDDDIVTTSGSSSIIY